MLRIRSTRLLSGVSAIAVIAGLGMSPSMAAPLYSGPGVFAPIINDQSGLNSLVVINADATIDKNPGTNASPDAADSAGDSFFNDQNMTGVLIKLRISDSFLLGDIENVGTMQSSTGDAILIHNDSQIGGRIFNSGVIEGGLFAGGAIVVTDDSTVAGGIFNTGTLSSGPVFADGIMVTDDSELFGGIYNSGLIRGAGDGIDFNDADVVFSGGIHNTSTGTILSTNATGLPFFDAAIQFWGGTFSGGINNEGTILGEGLAAGFHMFSAGTFEGGINNSGLIAGIDGIRITAGDFSGGITNNASGTILGDSGIGAIWIINLFGGTFNDGIQNDGLIRSVSANGIVVNLGTFNGGITNTGTIRAEGNENAILLLGPGAFNGGILNSGLIENTGTSRAAIAVVFGQSFNGSITNTGTGVITGATSAILVDTTGLWTGDIVNDGTLIGRSQDGIFIGSPTFFNGSIANNGKIDAVANGIQIQSGAIVTGNIINAGFIDPTNGITVSGAVSGVVSNPGTIEADVNGIYLVGGGATVGLGIENDGTILAGVNGINLDGGGIAHEVRQTGGLIQGNSFFDGTGAVTNALVLDQSGAEQLDVFTASGGRMDGNIVGGNTGDDMFVTTSTNFAYLRGTASGLDDFNMSGSGNFVMGGAFRGDASGAGILVNTANNMFFNGKGRVYVDDNTQANFAVAYTQVSGILEFYLTSNTAVHGQIAAPVLNLGGDIAAFINPASFAATGGDNFFYDNVMLGTTFGTFDNANNIITNSLFFAGKAIVNANDVDIALSRRFFGGGVLGNGLSHNQRSVAHALDILYEAGPFIYSPSMEEYFAYLFGLPDAEFTAQSIQDVLFSFNEIAGAEHAQMQQTSLDILNPFNTFMGQRLDLAKSSQTGVNYANRELRYAQSTSFMSDANQGMVQGPSGVSIWGRGYGQSQNVTGDVEAAGYEADAGGIVAGVDFSFGPNAIAGVALGWSDTDVGFNTFADNGSIDSFQLGAYGSWGFGHFYADATIAGAWQDLSMNRFVDLPLGPFAGGYEARSNYDADSFLMSGEFGAIWHSENVAIQPNVGLTWTTVDTDGFTERDAADFNLIVNSSSSESLASTLGVRLSTLYRNWDMDFMPQGSVAWRHEFEGNRQGFTAAFIDLPPSQFGIISSSIDSDSALVNAGVTAVVSPNVELFLDYNGLLNNEVSVHNGSVGVRGTW